jgi:PIH1 CS-like domain
LYYLEIRLQYDVIEEKADAKFDRKKKELKITLPIVQAPETKFELDPSIPLELDQPK